MNDNEMEFDMKDRNQRKYLFAYILSAIRNKEGIVIVGYKVKRKG